MIDKSIAIEIFNDISIDKDSKLVFSKLQEDIELVEYENNSLVVNANIDVKKDLYLMTIGCFRGFFRQESLYSKCYESGTILKIENIAFDDLYQNKGYTKLIHQCIEKFKYCIEELQLFSKTNNPMIWLKVGYQCCNNKDYKKIEEAFRVYLLDKRYGKGMNNRAVEYLLKKGLAKIEKKYFEPDEQTNQISFKEYFHMINTNDNSNTTNDILNKDVLELKELIPMYKSL
jgi:hypothetical protein